MALIATPGAEDADALVTFERVADYATAKGLSFAPNEDLGAPSIRRATTWLCTAWTWKGYRANGRSQALAWPRTGVEDAEGETVDPTTIPTEIEDACCEAAIYEYNNDGGLAPVVVLAERIKSESIGPIRTEYVVGQQSAEASRPILTIVGDMVSGLVAGANANPIIGTAVRR